jgi:hypothetical protein
LYDLIEVADEFVRLEELPRCAVEESARHGGRVFQQASSGWRLAERIDVIKDGEAMNQVNWRREECQLNHEVNSDKKMWCRQMVSVFLCVGKDAVRTRQFAYDLRLPCMCRQKSDRDRSRSIVNGKYNQTPVLSQPSNHQSIVQHPLRSK